MKNIRFFFCLILSLIFVLFNEQVASAEWFNVKWVNDGDTIVLDNGETVRYIGINSPEIAHRNKKAELYGYEAKTFNKELVFMQEVHLEFDKIKYDRYGRMLAYVFLKDGTFVNKAMVEKGYAYCLPYPQNNGNEAILLKAQRKAMFAKRGIWRFLKETKDGYVGHKKSKRFHSQKCSFGKKISKRNKILFERKRDAFWAGFAPCKKCIATKCFKK